MIKFLKGLLIGGGAILPGVSGGALAAIFGIYEPLISFMSNPKVNFKKNIYYFAPIFTGAIIGIILLSRLLSYFLTHNLTQISLFFVGCILGIFPSLIKQAALHGRKTSHIVLAITIAIVSFWIMTSFNTSSVAQISEGFFTWIMAGAILGLGLVLPGLATSNFLMYINLYEPMNTAISALDFHVLLPLTVGTVGIFILLSKLIKWLLEKYYAIIFHIIIGLVLTSTVMIMPQNANLTVLNAVSLLAGILLGSLMALTEKLKN